MSLIFLAGITMEGYGFICMVLLSFVIAYLLPYSSKNKEKPGCLLVGIVAIIVWFILNFPILISISIIKDGTILQQQVLLASWIVIIAIIIYVFLDKKVNGLKSMFLRVLLLIVCCIFFILFLTLFFGMIYFLYQRLYTHEQDGAPIWAVFLCIFFTATLILCIYSWLISDNICDKTIKINKKTTFYSLEKAKLKPEFVIELNLSQTKIDTFPMDILQFKNLKHLILNHNNIKEIPNELNQLQHLVGIDLSNNPISDTEKYRIRKLFSKDVEIVF